MNLIRWIYNKYVGFMYPAHKELSDQILHFITFFLLAAIQMIGRPHWWAMLIAVFISQGIAMTRKYYQHGYVLWYNFDLLWCGLGAIAGAAIPYIFLS